MKPTVTVIGSLNIDFTIKASRLPKRGESLDGKDFRMIPGGKGANQALAAAKLGAEVFLSGRVGSDIFGEKVINSLSQGGVNTDYVIKDLRNPTGVGLVILDQEGNNYILVARGANMAFKVEDLDRMKEVIAHSKILLLQLEIPLKVVTSAVKIAREFGVSVILDPAPASPFSKPLFSNVDILIPNQNEAEFYTKEKVVDEKTARKAAKKFLLMGAKRVIIKLGKDGAFLSTKEKNLYIPGIRVKVKDPTAAGDAFAGGFAVALARGEAIDQALKYANYVGALSVTNFGAQSSLPTKEEVAKFIKACRIRRK